MDNKCPSCGEKLKLFYLKPDCPKCGANLLYYDIEARLEEDAKKAQSEVESLQRFISKIDKLGIMKKRAEKKKQK